MCCLEWTCLKIVSPSIIYMTGLHQGIGLVSARSLHTSSTDPRLCGWGAWWTSALLERGECLTPLWNGRVKGWGWGGCQRWRRREWNSGNNNNNNNNNNNSPADKDRLQRWDAASLRYHSSHSSHGRDLQDMVWCMLGSVEKPLSFRYWGGLFIYFFQEHRHWSDRESVALNSVCTSETLNGDSVTK